MLQNLIAVDFKSKTVGYLVTDIMILGFIYLLPAISHLTSIPFYLFEPMRIALVFCIITTNQKNSMLVALTLPVLSLILSSHPDFAKSVLITAELTLNVFAFYNISERLNNKFIVMFLSTLIAKTFYYGGKLLFLNIGLLQGDLISTPIYIQCLVILILSIIAAVSLRNKKEN